MKGLKVGYRFPHISSIDYRTLKLFKKYFPRSLPSIATSCRRTQIPPLHPPPPIQPKALSQLIHHSKQATSSQHPIIKSLIPVSSSVIFYKLGIFSSYVMHPH